MIAEPAPFPWRGSGLNSDIMSTRPLDTSTTSWSVQRKALAAMTPSARIRVAIDLSESVREIRIQGLLARNPEWSRADAVASLIRRPGS